MRPRLTPLFALLLITACGPGDTGDGGSTGALPSAGGRPSGDPAASRARHATRAGEATLGPVAPSTAAMAETLRALADAADPLRDGFLNHQRIEIFRQQLAAGGMSRRDGFQTRIQLGNELLSDDRPREAVAEFEALLDELRADRDPSLRPLEVSATELLALSWLRLGEQDNCILHHGTASCLAPIEGDGVHTVREGSENAVLVLGGLLERRPNNLAARWMLNLAHMTLGSWPEGVDERWRIPESAFASDDDIGRFTDRAADWGVDVMGLCGGVVMEDLDGDDDLDLLVSSWSLADQIRLLRNDREAGFVDATGAAGLTGITGGLNLIHADADNDGDRDVLVLRGAWRREQGLIPNSLLANDGAGRFEDATVAAGIATRHPTQTAAWADYDGDGWLDLFVGNEDAQNPPHPCELFHNDGGLRFTDVAPGTGAAFRGYVKGTAWGDVDDDGDPDLYLSRNDGPNLLLENLGPEQGDPTPRPVVGDDRADAAPARAWRFVDVAAEAGVTEPEASFPCWFFDHDNDGDLDLWVSGYEYFAVRRVAKDYLGLKHGGPTPRLYRNRGDGTFDDVTVEAGADALLMTMGASFGDLDNDGWLDFYAGTGEPSFMSLYPNRMFRNAGDGTFLDVTTSGGFGHLQKGHGVAFGDLDADGDQDVYAVMGGAYSGDAFRNALFENPGHGRRWITLRLVGRAANRDGLGARLALTVETADGTRRTLHRMVGTGGSFGSQSLQQEIGLGDAVAIVSLDIRWPGSDTRQRLTDLPLDRIVEVTEGRPEVRLVELASFARR